MEKTGLAAVVTGEGPSLNEQPWLPPNTSNEFIKLKKAPLSMKSGNWDPNFAVAKEYKTD